jgi:hypothetical protein
MLADSIVFILIRHGKVICSSSKTRFNFRNVSPKSLPGKQEEYFTSCEFLVKSHVTDKIALEGSEVRAMVWEMK